MRKHNVYVKQSIDDGAPFFYSNKQHKIQPGEIINIIINGKHIGSYIMCQVDLTESPCSMCDIHDTCIHVRQAGTYGSYVALCDHEPPPWCGFCIKRVDSLLEAL